MLTYADKPEEKFSVILIISFTQIETIIYLLKKKKREKKW